MGHVLPSCHAPATDSWYSQLAVHEERVVGQRACAENKLARLWARCGAAASFRPKACARLPHAAASLGPSAG